MGRSKVRFDTKGSANDFKDKLEVYPKLSHGGGELLRPSSTNGLVLIPQPPSGYTVSYIRDCSGIGQAIVIIRPLQVDLDTSADTSSPSKFNLEGCTNMKYTVYNAV